MRIENALPALIGDHAIDVLLAMSERAIDTKEPKDRRFRVIRTQVLRGPEVPGQWFRSKESARATPS